MRAETQKYLNRPKRLDFYPESREQAVRLHKNSAPPAALEAIAQKEPSGITLGYPHYEGRTVFLWSEFIRLQGRVVHAENDPFPVELGIGEDIAAVRIGHLAALGCRGELVVAPR